MFTDLPNLICKARETGNTNIFYSAFSARVHVEGWRLQFGVKISSSEIYGKIIKAHISGTVPKDSNIRTKQRQLALPLKAHI